MRRRSASGSLLLLGAALLAGCGQKGPLVLPPTKPVAPAPAASARPPAPLPSVPAPPASPVSTASASSG